MNNYISRNLYQRKIEVDCGSKEYTYIGKVDHVVDNVLVLDTETDKLFIAIDKIYHIKELPND